MGLATRYTLRRNTASIMKIFDLDRDLALLLDRPRSIAIGGVLVCFGFVLMTLPQFLGERYDFVDISSNKSSISKNSLTTMCNQ